MCTLILRGVGVTIFAAEKQQVFHILCVRACVYVSVCTFSYPSCKARAPYYIVIFGLSGFTTFFHIVS